MFDAQIERGLRRWTAIHRHQSEDGEGSMLFDRMREWGSLHLLVGFLLGCAVAAVAVSTLRDWAWSLPVVLSGAAIALSAAK
jgi:hypothetical protein